MSYKNSGVLWNWYHTIADLHPQAWVSVTSILLSGSCTFQGYAARAYKRGIGKRQSVLSWSMRCRNLGSNPQQLAASWNVGCWGCDQYTHIQSHYWGVWAAPFFWPIEWLRILPHSSPCLMCCSQYGVHVPQWIYSTKQWWVVNSNFCLLIYFPFGFVSLGYTLVNLAVG